MSENTKKIRKDLNKACSDLKSICRIVKKEQTENERTIRPYTDIKQQSK